jgi:uncharacterized membrane protein YGL010W
MAKTAAQWFDEYGESHQNKVNKLIHWICVPIIFATVVGFLWAIPTPAFFGENPYINWATVAMVVSTLFYFTLSISLGIGMTLFTLATVALVGWYETLGLWPVWQVSLVIFVLAWIGQFIGHAIEGKKPSFFKDLQFLLIGPAWLMGFILKRIGIGY